ncbi:Histidine kinase [Pseudonocardia thermophila]|uniref:histidine kinase n=1 Tax=Pseudonocardia thermophila TaxID=1848 RepID=A0A1M7AEV0_PSETH|nr:Histidine kinase [Pseudonocardia thermophila]
MVAFVGFFVVVDVLGYVLGSRTTGAWGPAAGLVVRLVLHCSLLLVGRFPFAVAGVMAAGTAAVQLSQLVAPGLLVPAPALTGDPMIIGTSAAAVYTLWARFPRRRATWVLTALLALLATRPWQPTWETVPLGLLTTFGPALLARYFTARAELLANLRERAERAEEEGRAQERARLAAEMHDVVTHRVSLMVLQAGALEVTATDPATRTAAAAIREAGRQALDELREIVGVFGGQREGASPAVGPAAPAADLAELVEASVAAGVPVRLHRSGDDAHVPVSVARTAHRVVQEALTNVHKHAPGGEVCVDVRYTQDVVTVLVENSPPTAPVDPALAASGSGRGLHGLRERVELLGGRLQAGPRSDGGFRVQARLPVVPA